ncbi:LuxR family transcriptional regulator [Actinoplanes sp. NBRC 101535]|uniref:helix-turn-helix transcriptional regulator n=1 Tax=Actinoplanes sp. NBRC 101535 TaxID=3032196 RepID=UPI00255742B3|nr:LuxR family transcriptional regulator [Actinoplanes sp. NBRC 101535]
MRGRIDESRALRRFAESLRAGRRGVLVLRGDPGTGKTALLDEFAGTVSGVRLLRVAGVEAEADFGYAVLHRLLIPHLTVVDTLAPVHRVALRRAVGLAEGPRPDFAAIVRATAALFDGPGVFDGPSGPDVFDGPSGPDGFDGPDGEQPVLCCVDDAQWADPESLAVLRAAVPGLLVATRDPLTGAGPPPTVVVELRGLAEDDARDLLRATVTGPLDQRVAARLVTATGGNPLALIDLSRELTPDQLIGAQSLPDPLPVGSRLEQHYRQQIRDLPDDIRTWLLVAAAEPNDDAARIAAAATALGLSPEVRSRAAGLLAFREPLARSAIYSGAAGSRRRAVHSALAAATTRPGDADLRAWHLAAACPGTDETVAAGLVTASDHAAARGGAIARAAFLTRAAELTPDGPSRVPRVLAAAGAALAAGAPTQTLRLLETVPPGAEQIPHTYPLRAKALVMAGGADAYAKGSVTCLHAARALAGTDPRLAREALLEAAEHAVQAGHLIRDATPADIAALARRIPGDDLPGLLLAAFATAAVDGCEHAVPVLRRAGAVLRDPAVPAAEVLRHHLTGSVLDIVRWDPEPHRALWQRVITAARETGALWQLVTALYCAATVEVQLGDITAAEQLLTESAQVRAAIGRTAQLEAIHRHPGLPAWRATSTSHESPEAELAATMEAAGWIGSGSLQSLTRLSTVVLALGRGDYARARDVARDVFEADALGLHSRVLPDLVEAAVRSGDRVLADRALATLTVRATAAGTPWSLGVLARAQALLSAGAEPLHERAIALLTGTPARADLARAHLLHGEWLRRRRRRSDARIPLATAVAMFEEMGATAFATRARQELAAASASSSREGLTPQEQTIAQLAAAGATNSEIAAQLYLSANTVDHHLRKVYRKLDVSSRRQLPAHLHD